MIRRMRANESDTRPNYSRGHTAMVGISWPRELELIIGASDGMSLIGTAWEAKLAGLSAMQ